MKFLINRPINRLQIIPHDLLSENDVDCSKMGHFDGAIGFNHGPFISYVTLVYTRLETYVSFCLSCTICNNGLHSIFSYSLFAFCKRYCVSVAGL